MTEFGTTSTRTRLDKYVVAKGREIVIGACSLAANACQNSVAYVGSFIDISTFIEHGYNDYQTLGSIHNGAILASVHFQ